MVSKSTDTSKSFYKFGPHDNFIILGIKINTTWKYTGIVVYSFINSLFRAVFHNVLAPWMINNVQDEHKSKMGLKHVTAYEVCSVHVIYNWVDWLLYMNILLAQIDMMIIEIVADLLMTCATTYYYLRPPNLKPPQSINHSHENIPLVTNIVFSSTQECHNNIA